jgi:Fe-S cluster biosynthesis and repair protein YggX
MNDMNANNRTVFCALLKKEAPGLKAPPYPGALGQRIFNEISQEAWGQWVRHMTTLINENRLTPIEPKARAFLAAEMEKFLFGGGSAKPEGFKGTPDK